MYRAHCAVIFAIAQLSCYLLGDVLYVVMCYVSIGYGLMISVCEEPNGYHYAYMHS